MATIVTPVRIGLADRGRRMTNEAVSRDYQFIASLVLPDFATTVAELWIDVPVDNEEDAADPGVKGE